MKIAFHSAFLADDPIEVAIDKIAAAGYDGIELNAETLPWARPHVGPQTTGAERRRIRQRCADAGLGISSICAHTNLVLADPEQHRAAIQFSMGCVDLAADVETPVAHAICGSTPEEPAEAQWRRLREVLGECLDYAVQRGIHFALEPHVGGVVCDLATSQRMLAELAPRCLYINFDPSHLQVAGDDLPAAVAAFGKRIVHVHLKDARGTPAKWEFPPLGQGGVDFAAVFAALRQVGYDGWLSVEHEAQVFGYPSPEAEVLRDSLAFVRRALGSEG